MFIVLGHSHRLSAVIDGRGIACLYLTDTRVGYIGRHIGKDGCFFVNHRKGLHTGKVFSLVGSGERARNDFGAGSRHMVAELPRNVDLCRRGFTSGRLAENSHIVDAPSAHGVSGRTVSVGAEANFEIVTSRSGKSIGIVIVNGCTVNRGVGGYRLPRTAIDAVLKLNVARYIRRSKQILLHAEAHKHFVSAARVVNRRFKRSVVRRMEIRVVDEDIGEGAA